VHYVAPASFQASDYRGSVQKYIADEQAQIAKSGHTQKAANQSFAMFHQGPAEKGVALLLHGFNAGTEQWRPLAQEIFDKGYDVFVPSFPGHGLLAADGSEDSSMIPTLADHQAWSRFEDKVVDAVRGSGDLTVVGISVGGMLSLHLSERHADDPGAAGPLIQKVVSIAPYDELAGNYKLGSTELAFGPLKVRNQRVAEVLDVAELAIGAPVDRFLANQKVDRQGPHPEIYYGSRYVSFDNVLSLEATANETEAGAARLSHVPGGVHVLVTEADNLVDPSAAIGLAKSIGAELHVFPKADGVPHAMIHPLENKNPAAFNEARTEILSRL
jgi:pimeloyl-ACP methyl ester carboxylesterase